MGLADDFNSRGIRGRSYHVINTLAWSNSMRSLPRPRGFTLIELLVVITIIGILIGLLLPAVQQIREAANRMSCQNNIKQLALACHNYATTHDKLPPSVQWDAGEAPDRSDKFRANWVVLILPQLEQQAVHDSFNFDRHLSHSDNLLPRSTQLPVMICPTDYGHDVPFGLDGGSWARGNYAANGANGRLQNGTNNHQTVGPDSPGWQDKRRRGVMGANVSIKIDGAKDGTTNTLMLAEVRVGHNENDRRGTWAMGMAGSSALFWHGWSGDSNGPNNCLPRGHADDIDGCNQLPLQFLIEDCMSCPGPGGSWQAAPRSRHVGGVNAAFMDGSVHFISDFIETTGSFGGCCGVWDYLIASSDGQVIDREALGF